MTPFPNGQPDAEPVPWPRSTSSGERVHPEPAPPLVHPAPVSPWVRVQFAGWLLYFAVVLMPIGVVCYGVAALVRTVCESMRRGWRDHEMG